MKTADTEIVIKISEKVYNALTHTEFDANLVVDEMRKSIANGKPLVRCKDCKWFKKRDWCKVPDWFCADGERRDPCS